MQFGEILNQGCYVASNSIPDPAEGRTFLRTVGAQRASVRPSVHKKKAVFKWLQIEKYNEIERVCVP